jgi:serine/threonine-protein kinase
MLQGVLDVGPSGATAAGVLETLAVGVGPLPRVLLRDTENFNGPGPLVRPASSEMPDPAERAGRLHLFGEIAQGGMGAVLKGRDNDLGRDLAIKVLLERHASDPGLLRRFVEEAQIAGQLQHPGVVPVYELGAFADRRPYFAMKLVKGRTLAEVMDERSGPSADHPRLLAIFLDIAQTMAYAHARGVIHRDLKPSNIMVGSFGEVQVMDWGLAKVLPRGGAVDDRAAGKLEVHETVIATARSGPDSDPDLSRAGSVLGTPAYMAPEQARGENDRLDERADVFALGSILCEILTGQPAFAGRSSAEILRQAARGDLSGARERLEACGADAELVALARDALMPEVDDRPDHAGAVVDRLSAHLSGVQEKLHAAERERAVAEARAVEEAKRRVLADQLAVEAQAHADEERKRRRVTLALAASVLAILALGGGGAFWYAQQRQALLGRVSLVLREAEVLRDQALNDPGADPARWQTAQAATRRADDLLGESRDPSGRARLAELTRQIEAGLKAAQRDREMVDRLEQIHGDYLVHYDRKIKDSNYARAFREYGIDLDVLDPDEAARRIASHRIVPELAGAIDHWTHNRRMLTPPDLAGASRLSALVRIADPDPWRNQLRELLDRSVKNKAGVLDELRKLADSADLDRLPVASVQRLCSALTARGDSQRSIALLTAVYAAHPDNPQIASDLAGAYGSATNQTRDADVLPYALASVSLSPRSAFARSRLAECLNQLNRPEAALLHAREAVRLAPETPYGLVQLGLALLRIGKLEEAEAEFRMVKHSKENSGWINNIGVGYLNAGRGAEAVDYYREAVRLNPDQAVSHLNLGFLLDSQGKPGEAIPEFREAIRLKHDEGKARRGLGVALTNQGQLAEAIAEFHESIRIRPNNATVHLDLGGALSRQGKTDEAIAEYREAIRLKPDDADAHNNLGNALVSQGKLDEAVAALREAIRLEPDWALAHSNLGNALQAKGKFDEAVAECREAIRLKPDLAPAHFNLGIALNSQGKRDEAIAGYRKAIQLQPDYPEAHCNLGLILRTKGDYAGSLAMLRRGHELGTKQPGWRYPSARWVADTERLAALAERLPALLRGEDRPADEAERLAFAELCYYNQYHAASARLYDEALRANPALAPHPSDHRYNAACVAALAGCGRGKDEPAPDSASKAKLRQQALDWMKAEIIGWRQALEPAPAASRGPIVRMIQHSKADPDFSGVRDAADLAKLPEAERDDWQALWAEVDALLLQARAR